MAVSADAARTATGRSPTLAASSKVRRVVRETSSDQPGVEALARQAAQRLHLAIEEVWRPAVLDHLTALLEFRRQLIEADPPEGARAE